MSFVLQFEGVIRLHMLLYKCGVK